MRLLLPKGSVLHRRRWAFGSSIWPLYPSFERTSSSVCHREGLSSLISIIGISIRYVCVGRGIPLPFGDARGCGLAVVRAPDMWIIVACCPPRQNGDPHHFPENRLRPGNSTPPLNADTLFKLTAWQLHPPNLSIIQTSALDFSPCHPPLISACRPQTTSPGRNWETYLVGQQGGTRDRRACLGLLISMADAFCSCGCNQVCLL
jgi:hypothetical protein